MDDIAKFLLDAKSLFCGDYNARTSTVSDLLTNAGHVTDGSEWTDTEYLCWSRKYEWYPQQVFYGK